jgi:predicted PurR-regulated permease PerM
MKATAMPPQRQDLTHTTLAVLFIGGLIAAAFWILRPFLGALIWAAMIVVATWPLMMRVQRWLWGRRWLAVAVMLVVMLLVFVLPFVLAAGSIISNADQIIAWAKALGTLKLPLPPDWLQGLPFFGEKLDALWREYAASGMAELAAMLQPYATGLLGWFASEAGEFGLLGVQFLLTIVLAGILYAQGEDALSFVRRFFRRLAGERGAAVVLLAGQAIRAVALGVVVTALVQSVMGGIGLAVAGVPFAPVLTAAMFLLAVAQIGAAPVLFCATVWIYWSGDTAWAIAMLVWTILVGSLDNILRPILIRQGADLPLLLIFAGVIGGLITLGLVGLFVGPVVLAVTYTLLDSWMREQSEEN